MCSKEREKTIFIIQQQQKMKFKLAKRSEANSMIENTIFRDYIVYIQPREVEIAGVINFDDINDIDDMEEISVNVVNAPRLMALPQQESGTSIPTNRIKVNFSGCQLPTHMEMFGLFIKVRPWFQNAMFCDNCAQFQHTSKY